MLAVAIYVAAGDTVGISDGCSETIKGIPSSEGRGIVGTGISSSGFGVGIGIVSVGMSVGG